MDEEKLEKLRRKFRILLDNYENLSPEKKIKFDYLLEITNRFLDAILAESEENQG
ncbi:MAG TPA: hypothetical protein VF599_12465 [Pyrinomonadaceae bacterium]